MPSNNSQYRGRSSAPAKCTKLFIGGLSFDTTDDNLRSYFQTYGAVSSAVVMRDSVLRRSRGFGFVTFVRESSATRALQQVEHTIDGRRVEAKRAVPRDAMEAANSGTLSPATSANSRPGRGGAASRSRQRQASSPAPSSSSSSSSASPSSPPRSSASSSSSSSGRAGGRVRAGGGGSAVGGSHGLSLIHI